PQAQAVIGQANLDGVAQRGEADNLDLLAFEQTHFHETLYQEVGAVEGDDSAALPELELIEGRHDARPGRGGEVTQPLRPAGPGSAWHTRRAGRGASCPPEADRGTPLAASATGSRPARPAQPDGTPSPVRRSPRPRRPTRLFAAAPVV